MSSILSEPMRANSQPDVPRSTMDVVADFATLTKPRIGGFVFLAAGIGGWLGGGTLLQSLESAAYVTAIAGASCVFNMVLERNLDRLMPRTANRPLPAGRLSVRDALVFGIALTLIGTVGLAVKSSALAALLAVATLLTYAVIYTPLKRVSSLNTMIGAIPGAMPPLLGFVATAGVVGSWAWSLFALLFVWQFPHFLAIAWLYRDDYKAGGMRMLSTEPNSDGMVGRQALLYAMLLPVLACWPAMQGDAGSVFTIGAVVASLVFGGFAARFASVQNRERARALMFSSLVYLPFLFLLVLVDPATRRFL